MKIFHFHQLFDCAQVPPNHSKAHRKVWFVWCLKSSHDDKLNVEFEHNQSMAKFALFDLEGWIGGFNRLRKIAQHILNDLNRKYVNLGIESMWNQALHVAPSSFVAKYVCGILETSFKKGGWIISHSVHSSSITSFNLHIVRSGFN